MPSRQSDAQSSSSRDRLLQAAKRLFARQGYEQTATSAIAREAGTSESQLMRYFGGKVGLLEALFSDAWTDLNARIQRTLQQPTDTRGTILAVLQTVNATFARDPDLATLFVFESRRLRGDKPRVRLSEGFLAFAELARGLIRRAQAAREINPSLDAGAVASALMGASEGMLRDRILARLSGARAFSEREIVVTLDAMIRGFATTAAGAVRPVRRRVKRPRR